jgi:hypothetical protein
MSTTFESYCSISDLQDIVPEIGAYDRKRRLGGWVETATSNVYISADSGTVAQLYRDGVDLGAAAASIAAVNGGSDGDWFYDTGTDTVYLFSTLEPDANHIAEAGTDWEDTYTKAIARASSMIRSFVRRPILKRPRTAQDVGLRDYDECVIQATATLACSYLVGEEDTALRDRLYAQVFGVDTDPKGLAVQIREGEFRLWNEAGPETDDGDVRAVDVDSSTTGGISEVRGSATVSYDLVKVLIKDGGTFSAGSASGVTYSVFVADATGIKTSAVVTARTITGLYQTLAHGLQIRFATGVYTAGDEWEVEVNGQASESERRSAYIARI